MTVFWRYWLLQIPGWLALAAGLVATNLYFGLPVYWVLLLLVLWLLKDWAIYAFVGRYYQFRAEEPTAGLVGRRAVAEESLSPRGYVRLKGELWLAEIRKGSEPVASGEEVVVEAVEGLMLRVRRRE